MTKSDILKLIEQKRKDFDKAKEENDITNMCICSILIEQYKKLLEKAKEEPEA